MKKFIDCYIPTETCNLRCHYCYITQQRKFNNKLAKFEKTPQEIREALSQKRLGGVCLFNLCAGGETLLVQEIIDITRELLDEGHYVMIVTNGTLTTRFKEIEKLPKELLERLFFKFSFHYLELLRINKLDEYFENVQRMKTVGCSFTIELTPSDETIEHIDDMKKICLEKVGAECHVTIARDDRTKEIEILSNHNYVEYKKIWGVFNSELFNFKADIFYKKRKEFCYAGDWSFYLNLVTGVINQCYCGKELDNIYEDIDKSLKLEAIGKNCTLPHCYNGHAFLSLGIIPELKTPSYAELRSRKDNEAKNWLNSSMQKFMELKLKDSNQCYSKKRKIIITIKQKFASIEKINKKLSNSIKKRIPKF